MSAPPDPRREGGISRNEFRDEHERLRLLEHLEQKDQRLFQMQTMIDDLEARIGVVGSALQKLNTHHTHDHHAGGEQMPVDQEIAWGLVVFERPHMLKAWRQWRAQPLATHLAEKGGA
jgi:hypothetical protein